MTTEGHAVSRRGLLRGAGLVGLGAVVSGCGSSLAAGVTGAGPSNDTLSYWNLLGGGAVTTFATGKAGFFFEGDWEITTFETAKTPFSMIAFPNVFGGRYAAQADSHSFVLPKDPARTNAKRQMIFSFIRSMVNQSSTWAQGGHIPAWLPYQKSAAYDTLKPASNYKWVANYVRYDDPAWYSGSGSDFENIMGFAIGAVAAGQTSPAAAVSAMRSRLTQYANTPSPV